MLLGLMKIYVPAASAALPVSSPSGEEVWRLNCGADFFDYTDPQGNWWMKDEKFSGLERWGFSGGNLGNTTQYIALTDLQPVFQTSRWGGTDMQYHIALPKGVYQVKLLFAETYWTGPGQRVFDVAIESVTVLSNHDVYLHSGVNAADVHTFWPTISDGVLDITFPKIAVDQAMISGIEVSPFYYFQEDDLLDFVEKRMFKFFWDEADPATGLIKDRESNWAPGTYTHSSIAATGFGLSAMTVAASRGWITPQQARDRIMKILDTFESGLTHVHGFWYHWLKLDTGVKDGNSELSSVDSSLFILGALQAGEYFRPTYPEIAAKAETLYRRMDWTWWTNRGPQYKSMFINQAWKPGVSTETYTIPGDNGHFTEDWWDRYSETVLVNLLAFGSPTYSISTAAWTNMNRKWENGYGQHFVYEPPLFTQQYQSLYFNFRSNGQKQNDSFMDAYDTILQATLHNRSACLLDPLARYSANRWGLTACDGPGNIYRVYGAPPGGGHDGTVAPTAAITSLPFTPAESMAALRHMFFQYKHHIWGRYGFTDAFNVQQDFASRDVLALDQGAMIMAIENYRTGMIQNTAMANPYIRLGLERAGFKSFNREPFYDASTVQDGIAELSAKYAGDGDPSTRWSSMFTDQEWLSVRLPTATFVNGVTLDWEAAYGKSYQIQTSLDGNSWTAVYQTANGDGGRDAISFPAVFTQYVRMNGTQRGTAWGYSIYEMKISTPQNLIANPGFEKDFANWTRSSSGQIDLQDPYEGLRSAKIYGNVQGSGSQIYTSIPIPIVAASKYQFSVLSKRQNIVKTSIYGGAQADVAWLGAGKNLLSITNIVSGLAGTSGWTPIQKQINPPSSAVYAVIVMSLNGAKGTAWFDQVQFFPAQNTASPASQFAALALETPGEINDALFLDARPDLSESIAADPAFKAGAAYSFPNPSSAERHPVIHVETGLADSLEIRIYDVSGKIVHEARLDGPPPVIDGKYAYEYTWNSDGAASGIYLLAAKSEKAGQSLVFKKKMAVIK